MADMRSSLTLLAASDCPVQLIDLKRQLRIEQDVADDDDLLNGYLSTAQNNIEGRDGVTGRAMLTQRWRLTLEAFYDPRIYGGRWSGSVPSGWCSGIWGNSGVYNGEIRIPLPPLQSIDAVKYLDATETLQTVDPTTYRVIAGEGNRSSLIPKGGFSWPSTAFAPDAVQIDFTAGYTTQEALVAERQGMIHAMLMMCAHWYENRESVTDGRVNQPFEVPMAVERLLAPHTIYSF